MSRHPLTRLTSVPTASSLPILPIFAPRVFKPWLFASAGPARLLSERRHVKKPVSQDSISEREWIRQDEAELQAAEAYFQSGVVCTPDTFAEHGTRRRRWRRTRAAGAGAGIEAQQEHQHFRRAGKTLDSRFLPFRNSARPTSPNFIPPKLRNEVVSSLDPKRLRPKKKKLKKYVLKMSQFRAVIRQEMLLWRGRTRRVDNTPNRGIRPLISRKLRRRFHKYATVLRIWDDDWMRGFAQVNAKYNQSVPRWYRSPQSHPSTMDPAFTRHLRKRLRLGVAETVTQFARSKQKRPLLALLLHVLHRYPERGLELLEHIPKDTVPAYIMADCFEHLVSYHLRGRSSSHQGVSRLLHGLKSLETKVPSLIFALQPKIWADLIYHSHIDETSELTRMLLARNVFQGPHLRCLIAWRLAQHGHYQFSMKMLESAISRVPTTLGPIYAKTASTILSRSILSPDGYGNMMDIVEAQKQAGIAYNMYHYVILVQNAVKQGDHRVALNIFQSVSRQMESMNSTANTTYYPPHMAPKDYVYLCCAMLKACRDRQDTETLRYVLQICMPLAQRLRSRPLALQILHHTYLFRQSEQPDLTYHYLVQLYLDFFDPKPLRELGIIDKSNMSAKRRAADAPRLVPSTPVIGFMLAAYLENVARPNQLRSLYDNYSQLVNDGHPIISRTAWSTSIHNAFILAMSRHPSTLPLCAHILSDMASRPAFEPKPIRPLASTEPDRPRRRLSSSRGIIHPARPSTLTFNILINAYTRFGQYEAAEKARDLMDRRQLAPDVVTFTTLIAHWVRRQDVDNVVRALQDMSEWNVEVGELTTTLLLRIKNQPELGRALRDAGLVPDHQAGDAEEARSS